MIELSTEQKILLDLIGFGLKGKAIDPEGLETADWKEVIRLSLVQAVPGLAFDAAEKAGLKEVVTSELWDEWSGISNKNLVNNILATHHQQKMVGIMEENHYNYAIIKGTSAALYYPEPKFRSFGDCDFLMEKEKIQEISEKFIQNGYVPGKDNETHRAHLCFYNEDGADLEMHFDINGLPEGPEGDEIRNYLSDVFDCSAEGEVMGSRFITPAPRHHAVVILVHMAHHLLGTGVGLRHIMDWGVFVDKTSGESFWDESLLPFLKKVGLYNFAQISAKTCGVYFGTAIPSWCEGADDNACDDLMYDTLSGGNFGRNNPDRALSGKYITTSESNKTGGSKLANFYKSVCISTERKFPVVKKYKILRPFCNIINGFGYGLDVIRGKKASVVKGYKYADERKKILDGMKLYEK